MKGTPNYRAATDESLASYWALPGDELARRLRSGRDGLSAAEAELRLRQYGPNALDAQKPLSRLRVVQNQLRSPLLLLLIFAAGASILSGEWFDAAIVLVIVAASAAVGYSREYGAQAAAEALRARIRTRTRVLRDGRVTEIDTRLVVPGDVVLLAAGAAAPNQRQRSRIRSAMTRHRRSDFSKNARENSCWRYRMVGSGQAW